MAKDSKTEKNPRIEIPREFLTALNTLKVPFKSVRLEKLASFPDYPVNPTDYIFLEGKDLRQDSYPDLWVCKYKLGIGDAVDEAAERIGMVLGNTAFENNGKGYIGKISREQALKLNLVLGGKTLNVRQAKDFLALLLSNKAYDGTGKKINKDELVQITNEILVANNTGEWLEDFFTGKENNLVLNKNYILQGDTLFPYYHHNLTHCLTRSKKGYLRTSSGIDLNDWMENSTAQGFIKEEPPIPISNKGLIYVPPYKENHGVAISNEMIMCGLFCQVDSRRAKDKFLGVRHVRFAHDNKCRTKN